MKSAYWEHRRPRVRTFSESDRAYAERLSGNKARSTASANRAQRKQERADIIAYNNAPLDMRVRDHTGYHVKEKGSSNPFNSDKKPGHKRRAEAVARATPNWADADAMMVFYDECRRKTEQTGVKHHVDHIVPIQSGFVCGLHCQQNMAVLPAMDNIKKGAKRWPGMPDKLDRRMLDKYRKQIRHAARRLQAEKV